MITTQQIVLFFSALVASALKAWVTNSQATLSKKSIADVVIGGCCGILAPQLFSTLFPAWANLGSQAAIMFVTAYTSSDLINNVLAKMGLGASTAPLLAPDPPPKVLVPDTGKPQDKP